LTTLDMVRVGDWIEMPQYDADGDVVDIALHTIRVQNWDKTITTIPTHQLISESFRNWRGMQDSGGRRIKRSLNIDSGSVRFLTDEEVEKFTRFTLLREYIHRKRDELAAYNAALDDPETANVNLRRLTNLGTFRAYLWNYLQNHPQIHHGMTLLVRQLQPGEKGIPIEIYCFTGTTEWAAYEGIQADIFDHVLAQCRDFGLSVFQSPSGTDIAARAGLIHEVAEDGADLDARVGAHCRLALAASPEAIAGTKALVADLGYGPDPSLFETGLGWNVKTRMSDAAQEGIGAFLERRKARWVVDE